MRADEIFAKIGTGHANAIRGVTQTKGLRKIIQNANKTGDCIINVGNGYYRPDPTDPTDCAEMEHYIASELHRAREILYKREKLKDTWEKIINENSNNK